MDGLWWFIGSIIDQMENENNKKYSKIQIIIKLNKFKTKKCENYASIISKPLYDMRCYCFTSIFDLKAKFPLKCPLFPAIFRELQLQLQNQRV